MRLDSSQQLHSSLTLSVLVSLALKHIVFLVGELSKSVSSFPPFGRDIDGEVDAAGAFFCEATQFFMEAKSIVIQTYLSWTVGRPLGLAMDMIEISSSLSFMPPLIAGFVSKPGKKVELFVDSDARMQALGP